MLRLARQIATGHEVGIAFDRPHVIGLGSARHVALFVVAARRR
jgi:hypothetical protein